MPLLLPFPICILEKWNAFKQENKEQLLFPLPESHSPSTNSISEGGEGGDWALMIRDYIAPATVSGMYIYVKR